ncbi:hypothetical protein FVE67_06615 [Thermosulfurimonas marina]|uniref:MotA/TolQ/ExbB proton channel domain-containing protein n=1 Tax=Thermosulfurimonas marina TaxID=2047767 RepID=A0A6H1WTJ2_9BACT|nr:MotA/TolQ/ExbB proton channel family protein [Thermosulfurimonas marina]QJA06491.1 hypothetical protein FVE67_06615 [Thermosulfurimonas marina]
MSLWHLILSVGPMGKFTLGLLFLLSVFTWAVILAKWQAVRRARRGLAALEEAFGEEKGAASLAALLEKIPEGLLRQILKDYLRAYSRLKKEYARPEALELRTLWFSGLRTLLLSEWERIREERTRDFPSYLGFLATVGNTAPFIGLFGTVWGIMAAFHRIGLKGNATLATVAPGIAEALIATAMGLFAAIPAVVAYNYFTRAGEAFLEDLSRLERRLLVLCERELLSQALGQEV